MLIVGCSQNRTDSGEAESESARLPVENATHDRTGKGEDQQPVPTTSRSIRIATYNINYANARLDAVVEAIRRADADLVCLQETNEESAALLRREFGQDYPTIGFFGSVRPYAAGGFGLLSRIPVGATEFLPAKHGLFGACVFEIEHDNQPVQVTVLHLQPVRFASGKDLAGRLSALSALATVEEVHGNEMNHVVDHIRSDIPAIVVGDFNSCSTFRAPALLREQGFVDSFAAVNDEADSHPTWHWPTKHGEVSLRIDYIFHSPLFQTLESRVIATRGSDHYLLLSELIRQPPD